MFELTTFNNSQFGDIRVADINGEPWFVGKDVAIILGYERTAKAVVDRVDDEDRKMIDAETQSQLGIELGQRGGWLINESGLYSLVLTSKLESAKAFKRWVTSEVLPAIRKTGGYQQNGFRMSDALLVMANVAKLAEENQRRLNAVEESQKELVGKLDKAAEAFTAPSFSPDTWQENARATIAAIVQENGLSYQAYTGELYKKLESVACVDLTSRQTFKRKRMKAEGATYRDRQAVSKLSIIAADAKLRAIFDGVLREEKVKRLVKGA